tara:strand:- start:1109 stop:1516 length:408 start_codon:yes stop_codon:yes gene_type:complete
MRTTQELIGITMTALTALSNHIKENTHLYEDFDVAMDNQKEANETSDGEELDELIKVNSLDVDELNKEFPPQQYTDGHVLEVMKERLDKPEEGKIYSLHKLSETKEWSKSEVIEDVQLNDVEMTEVDLDDLFNGL